MRMRNAALMAIVALCGCGSVSLNRVQQQALDTNQRAARAFQAGHLEQARALYQEASRLDASIEDLDGLAANLLSLARVEQAAGKPEAAHQYLDRVLGDGALGDPRQPATLPRQAEAAARKAQLHLASRDLDRAAAWSARAEDFCRRSACASLGAILNLRARTALQAGDATSALAFSQRALAESGGESDRTERANALRVAAEAQLLQKQPQSAFGALDEALRLDQALGLPARIIMDLMLLGQTSEQLQRPDDARSYYRRALDVGAASGDAEGQTQARARLDRVQGQIH